MALLSRSDFLYQARVYDTGGALVGVYDDLVSLYYKKPVNESGMAVLTVPDTHRILPLLVDDLLLEVWLIYRPFSAEISAVQDFTGLYRDRQTATDGNGNIYHLLYFPGINEILSRDIIAYPPGINGKSTWTGLTHCEIARQIVEKNCTSVATVANGRLRNANPVRNLATSGVAMIPTINYSASYRNVLEVVQELAVAGTFDFAVHRISATGATDMKWEPYAGQLGTDLSASIIFDLNLDNIKAANLDGGRLREKTVAVVGGQGEGTSRAISVRTGLNQSASNDYELFVDARSNADSELASIGDSRLRDAQARRNIDVDVAPSSGYVYRRDYGMGDLVTVSFAGTMIVKKISAVEVKFDQDQNTTIQIELKNP